MRCCNTNVWRHCDSLATRLLRGESEGCQRDSTMTRPMTHTTPMTSLFGVATLLLLCIASTGCTHPVLGRPALLGASVTSGAGAAVTAGVPFDTIPTEALARAQSSARDGSSVSVDAAVAFSAVVRAPHVVPLSLGNGGVFIRVFFVAGKELDRFVVWDYVKRRRSILG